MPNGQKLSSGRISLKEQFAREKAENKTPAKKKVIAKVLKSGAVKDVTPKQKSLDSLSLEDDMATMRARALKAKKKKSKK